MSIEVRQLGFRYGERPVIDGVDAVARDGAITVVLGPNAIGKTTLLRCVAGGLRPTRGRVHLDGRSRDEMKRRAVVPRLAYVAQRPVVGADLTVREVVALGRYALPRSPDRIDDALACLDLARHADRPFAELSTGQQQRVALARALAQADDDGHLVLDEPTSAMDLHHVRRVAEVLRERARAGGTVLLASHDLAVAARLADEVWLFGRETPGRLVAAGAVDEVLTVERLRDVFRVDFAWLDHPDGGRVLVGGIPERAPRRPGAAPL